MPWDSAFPPARVNPESARRLARLSELYGQRRDSSPGPTQSPSPAIRSGRALEWSPALQSSALDPLRNIGRDRMRYVANLAAAVKFRQTRELVEPDRG